MQSNVQCYDLKHIFKVKWKLQKRKGNIDCKHDFYPRHENGCSHSIFLQLFWWEGWGFFSLSIIKIAKLLVVILHSSCFQLILTNTDKQMSWRPIQLKYYYKFKTPAIKQREILGYFGVFWRIVNMETWVILTLCAFLSTWVLSTFSP